MTIKNFYIVHGEETDKILDAIEIEFPCWIMTEDIEMDFMKVTIKARTEDMEIIEKRIKKIVDKQKIK